MVRRLIFAPIRADGDELALAGSDPFNVSLMALVRMLTGKWPRPLFAPGRVVIESINAHYAQAEPESTPISIPPLPPPHAPVEDEPEPAPGPEAKKASDKSPAKPAAAKKPKAKPTPEPARMRIETDLVTDNVSAVQLVSSIIESAIELHTTDIHVEPQRAGMSVRFRIDGELHRIMNIPEDLAQPLVSRVKVLAEMDVTERRRPQDGHFELPVEDRTYDFRISTLPSIHGEKLVVRILDTARVRTRLSELGMLPEQEKAFSWMINRPHGMILVTGPTGSGKTSTLYAALNALNQENRNLVTIEDPVEYQLVGITQVQVDTQIDMTFAAGLRSILRQDPDVIMVGEIRDSDTAYIAIRAAMTGHLVLSTLHTNTALGAIDALVNLGRLPFTVAGSLVGIVSQRLVRQLCPECRKAQRLTPALRATLGIGEEVRKRIYKANGCQECLGSGYQGRSGAFEVVKINEAIREAISEGRRGESLEPLVREHKMLSMQDAAVQKVLAGKTSVDEISSKILLEL
jgi:type II secretory ATPase GspE/PulE/Tfp pilus assembly ATPase PilB-like protein